MLYLRACWTVSGVVGAMSLCLTLGTAVGGEDEFPPGTSAETFGAVLDASNAEKEAYAEWHFERHDSYAVQSSAGYALLSPLIYDLAYPYRDPSNDDRDLAVSLAERVSMVRFDAKEVVLADLKYGPEGMNPDPVRYQHGLEKTALYLMQLNGSFLFPLDIPDYRSLSVEQTRTVLNSDFVQKDMLLVPQPPSTLGDGSAMAIAQEVVDLIPTMRDRVNAMTRCDLLLESAAFRNGTSSVGRDLEMAELYLVEADRVEGEEKGLPDVAFYLAIQPSPFSLNDRSGFVDSKLALAATDGHPEASYLMGQRELAVDNVVDALQYFTVAELQGHAKARIQLKALQQSKALRLTNEQVEFAEYTASRYSERRCSQGKSLSPSN